jgi:hypothetical protein
LNYDAEKQTKKVNELSVGTTKITAHFPGYNGFIPATDLNEKAKTQAVGVDPR